MAEFDFANPPVSQITDDLAGVALLLWGGNGVGKTPVACGMPKPYYLAFEGGLTGISGVPFYPVKSWKDFLKFVKWATSPATTDKAHEVAQTIILDTVDVMADYCIDYICARLGVSSLGETRLTADGKKDGSVNGYTEYGREFRRATRALRTAGFTLVYIAHDGGYRDEVDRATGMKYTKMYPSGDKRAIEPICNDVDVIGYMQPAPLDDAGRPVFSTVFFAPNPQYHTRSRYTQIVPYIERVTAKSLCDAIIDAKRKQLEIDGVAPATFAQQQAPFEAAETSEVMSFNDLKDAIKQIALKFQQEDRFQQYREIADKHMGTNAEVMKATFDQAPILEAILADLKKLL